MKKKDGIVIIVISLIIGIGYAFYHLMQPEAETVEVYYKNKLIQTVDINQDKIYTFHGSYGSFSLEVKNHQYHAVNVDCPNHDCMKVGWVKKGSSKQIVCVPNEIYIIQSDSVDNVQ